MNYYKPKYFILENVKMKKESEKIITDYLGVNPIEINSSLVSAQNRKRLYWTNIPNVEQPKDKGITWGQVREVGVNTKKYYYGKKAMQWLGKSSVERKRTLDVHSNMDKMQMLEASHSKKYSNQRFFGIIDVPSEKEILEAMIDEYSIVNKIEQNKKLNFTYDDYFNCLNTVQMDGTVLQFTQPNSVPKDDFFFRYITPKECERLQTLPDGYTREISDTQRYKVLGNGWTVDVIKHILCNMEVDDVQ